MRIERKNILLLKGRNHYCPRGIIPPEKIHPSVDCSYRAFGNFLVNCIVICVLRPISLFAERGIFLLVLLLYLNVVFGVCMCVCVCMSVCSNVFLAYLFPVGFVRTNLITYVYHTNRRCKVYAVVQLRITDFPYF